MLISETAIVKWNNKNRKYYESLGYVFTHNGDEFEVLIEQLSKASKAKVKVLCDFCKETIVEKSYQTYLKQRHEKYGDCCVKCQPLKNKLVCIDKYGVDNGSKTLESIQKIKDTCEEKYGVDNPARIESARIKISESSTKNVEMLTEKREKTMYERYGTYNPMYVEEFKNKQKNTFLEHYGVTHPKQNEEIKAKERQHNLEKYGYEYVGQVPEFQEKKRQTCLDKYGVECSLSADSVRAKIFESYLQNGNIPTSKQQIKVGKMLQDIYEAGEINVLCGKYILDCVLEKDNKKIDIEYDGAYWHKDKERDNRRDKYVQSQGYKVLRIVGGHAVPTTEQLKNAIDELLFTENNFIRMVLE